jgi:Glycosyl transferase family 2
MFKRVLQALSNWKSVRFARRPSQFPKLGVLAIMKNEALNIDEWVEHYLWMGADRIWLIDNGSTDDTVAKARAWEARGKVRLIELPKPHRQRIHYWKAYRAFGIEKECDWLLIADLDEFWFCPNGDTLPVALAEYPEVDVIYANWAVFGSGGLIAHPPSVRAGFTLRRPGLARHGKYICRTQALSAPEELHLHQVKSPVPLRTVTETQRFQLNHYPIQSLEFFRSVKMTRGDAGNAAKDTMRDMDYFHAQDAGCTESDRRLADLVASHRTS